MTDIIIQGIGGRMGHVLCEMIAQREDCRVVAGVDMKDGENAAFNGANLSKVEPVCQYMQT